jgi:hypothetical protein
MNGTNGKTPSQILKEVENSINGLRLEVEGLRMHTGSTGEFILISLEHLKSIVEELKKVIK